MTRVLPLKNFWLRLKDDTIVQTTLLFLAYYISAHLGLSLTSVNKFAALMWPPTGIALAFLVMFGHRLWPGIFLGAFLVNFLTGAPVLAALGIATGNTIEALIGLYFCTRGGSFDISMQRRIDVVRLAGGAALISTMFSATIGVGSLFLHGIISKEQLQQTWIQWWAGDALGALAVTPLILVFSSKTELRRLAWKEAPTWEQLCFLVVLVALSVFAFGGSESLRQLIGFPGLYSLVPVLLWACMRFGLRGSAVASFFMISTAIWYTSQGLGPFSGSHFFANMLHLMIFGIVFSIIGLFVGSVVAERETERETLQAREEELIQARKQAEAANQAKTLFLANVSHELRTPLSAVIGFSELSSRPDLSAAEKAEFLAVIQRNGSLLQTLINDLLDLSKIESQKMQIHISETALPELMKDIEVLLGPQARGKGLKFSVSVEKGTPLKIYSDPIRLRQILINLVGNAVKFTSQGSIHLVACLSHPRGEPTKLAFLIRDTGVGLKPDEASRLFEPFAQGATTKRAFGGSGLGLALSKRLAQLLGGDVVLDQSLPDEGSTFLVTVDPGPVKYSDVEFEVTSDEEPNRLNGIRILLTDDSTDNQVLVCRILQKAGATVDVASNGREALEKAREHKYDVLLMDLQMPVMDGYEATREIRSSGYKGKIFALTAFAMAEDRERCLADGFDDHFSKPVDKETLIRKLNVSRSPNYKSDSQGSG